MKAWRAFAAGLTMCSAYCSAAGATMSFCSQGAPEGFDIVRYETVITLDAASPIFDQLLAFKPGTTQLEPSLAERWDVSADGLVYTLHLRAGVKFHATPWFTPTREMNVDDVLWSIQRLNDKAHPAHGVAKSGYVYWTGMGMPALIRSVEKIDALTLRITLTRPEAPFLADLAMPTIGTVYSAEYGEQLRKAGRLDDLNTRPIGTGPFVFRSYQKDAVVRFAAHPGYWRGPRGIDNLIFAITTDPAVRVQRIKAGECQVAQILPSVLHGFDGDRQNRVERAHPIMTDYLAPNAKHRFTGDRRFREALWLAIEKKSYVEAVWSGLAIPAVSFLPPGVWSHDATLPQRFDVERARALVKASGYDGSEITLFATAKRSDTKRATEILQGDWAAIGVKVRVELMELGELYRRASRGEHDIALLSWYGDNGDPDNFFTPNLSCPALASGGSKAQWCDPALDTLLDQARRESDPARRATLYVKAQRLLYDAVALIPLDYATEIHAMRKDVRGVALTPFGDTEFRFASFASPTAASSPTPISTPTPTPTPTPIATSR